jgi:hypothetical protein
VLDPAAGGGVFLIQAALRMREGVPEAQIIDLATPCHFPHLLDGPDGFTAIVRQIAV